MGSIGLEPPSPIVGGCGDDEEPGTPLQISVVVRLILESLPTTSILRLRFLSRLWSEEALLVLKDRVTVCFLKNSPFPLEPSESLEQVVPYSNSRLNELGFPNWRIRLPIKPESTPGLQRTKEYRILRDLNWLLNPFYQHHNVSSLHLSGALGSDTSLELHRALLSGLKGTLSSLTLKIKLNSGFSLPEGFCFDRMPALASLSLWMDGKAECQSSSDQFIKELLPAVQGIQSLTVVNLTLRRHLQDYFVYSSKVLKEVVRIQAQAEEDDTMGKGFRSLSEVAMASTYAGHAPLLVSLSTRTVLC